MARKRFSDLNNVELQAAFEKIYKSGFSYADESFQDWEKQAIAANDMKGVKEMQEIMEKMANLLANPPNIEEIY